MKLKKFRIPENLLYPSIYLIISLVIIWSTLSTYGPIGYRHDWGYAQYSEMSNKAVSNLFYSWNTNDLGFSYGYSSPFLYTLLTYSLTFFGVGGVFLTKSLVFSFLFFSGVFMFFLASYFMSKRNAFLSGLFYMLTPVMFNKIVAGHVTYLFSYMFAPLAFLLFLKAKDNYKKMVLAGLVTSLLMMA